MKVVTAVVNNPDFIEMQYYTLKKYFKGDYEFIVFNDAKTYPDFTNGNDITMKDKIEEMCNKHGIKCINIMNDKQNVNMVYYKKCAEAMNVVLKYQIDNPDKYLLLDSDMFLIDNFDISKYEQYDCAIVLQSRNNHNTNYFWNGIYYFNMMKMKNINLLNWNDTRICDVGGMMEEWLKTQMGGNNMPNTDTIRWTDECFHTNDIYFIRHLWSCTWNESELPQNLKDRKELIDFFNNDPRNTNNKYFCEIYDNIFLHYRAGGNWKKEGLDLHRNLTNKLKNVLLNE